MNRRDAGQRDDIGCLKAIEMLHAYLDGELPDATSVEDFEHHLAHCRGCCSRAEFEELVTERLRRVADERAPERLRFRMRRILEEI